jgi:hypothetical protein
MCVRRKKMPLWLRLDYLALYFLILPQMFNVHDPWRMSLNLVGAMALLAAIVLMFADRRRSSGTNF